MDTTEGIAAEAVSEIRSAVFLQEERRTANVRRVAELFLKLRERHSDPKGRGADYAGRSKEYRQLISTIYEEAFDGVPEDVRTRVTSQIRYHLSTGIRDHLAQIPGALELYGYNPKSVKERASDRIKQRRALLDMGLIDEATSESSHAARLVHGARYLVQLATEEGLDYSDQEDRNYVRHGAAQIAQSLPSLLTDVDKIRAACELLGQVSDSFASEQAPTVREEMDRSLTAVLEDARRLRRHTTTAENTVEAINGLLGQYKPREQRRKAR